MQEYDFDLHVGQDYGLTYIIEGGESYDGYTAVLTVMIQLVRLTLKEFINMMRSFTTMIIV